MATSTGKAHCLTCETAKVAYKCEGCSQYFCLIHLSDHHQGLGKQLDEIEDKYNLFRETLNEKTQNSQKYPLIEQINQWENDSVNKIRQQADESRALLLKYINKHIQKIETKFIELTEELKEVQEENNLNEFKTKFKKLEEEFNKPSHVSVERDFTPFIDSIYVHNSTRKYFSRIN